MPEVLLFGATGYTGRLTARALHERGASFVLCGRDRPRLEALAPELGGAEVRVADVGDVGSLVRALDGVKVMITCVGPFVELGSTAVEAALRAGVHYIDSTGEGEFITRLFERDADARAAGIAMAPALAFDEVPADVAATLATQGMTDPDLVLTYAVPTFASPGTVVSSLGIIAGRAPWIVNHETVWVGAGERERWAPMPPPLGPKPSISAPLAELYLAPRHLDLKGLKLFVTAGTPQRSALRLGLPVLRAALGVPPVRSAINAALRRVVPAPSPEQGARRRFTILAEARDADAWRNVAVSGADVYGLSAQLLAAGAMHMASTEYDRKGVVAPAQAIDVDVLQKELIDHGVAIDVYE